MKVLIFSFKVILCLKKSRVILGEMEEGKGNLNVLNLQIPVIVFFYQFS